MAPHALHARRRPRPEVRLAGHGADEHVERRRLRRAHHVGRRPARRQDRGRRVRADRARDAGLGPRPPSTRRHARHELRQIGGMVVTNVASEPAHDFINQGADRLAGRIVVAGGCVPDVRRALPARRHARPDLQRGRPTPGIAITEVATQGETNAEILGLALDQRGRIVGGGYTTVEDGGSFEVNSAVVRFLPDGTLDPSFNPSGPRPGTVITEVGPGLERGVPRGDRPARPDRDGGRRLRRRRERTLRHRADTLPRARGTLDDSFGDGGNVLPNAGPGDSDDDAQGLAVPSPTARSWSQARRRRRRSRSTHG